MIQAEQFDIKTGKPIQVVIDGQNQTGLFNVTMTDRLVGNDFPHLVGLTLRNGLTVTSPMEQGSQTSASAIQMNTGGFVFIDFTLMENVVAAISQEYIFCIACHKIDNRF